jgi:hypothetical protein
MTYLFEYSSIFGRNSIVENCSHSSFIFNHGVGLSALYLFFFKGKRIKDTASIPYAGITVKIWKIN